MQPSKKPLDSSATNTQLIISNPSSCRYFLFVECHLCFCSSQKDPSKYSLYIADDDGQAEDDFPPLTHARPIGQYDFPHLTLIEQVGTVNSSITSALLKNDKKPNDVDDIDPDDADDDDDDDGSFDDSSRSITPPPSSTLDEHRKSNSSQGKPNTSISPQDDLPSEVNPIDKINRLFESLEQKTYLFDYYHKPNSSKHIPIRLDVSGEQIRLELLKETNRLSWQTMSVTTQRLIDCTISNTKDGNKKRGKSSSFVFSSSIDQ